MMDGAGLLIAGHGTLDATDDPVHVLGHIGESLLATTNTWRVRRVSAMSGERDAPDRAGLKRAITELVDEPVQVILLAIIGVVVEHEDEPALISGATHRENPADATLPLRWICHQLRACRAERVVVVMSAAPERSTAEPGAGARWMDALGTARPRHLVAIDPSGARAAAMSALLQGLRGAAVDRDTGTITLRSLGAHLACSVQDLALQSSEDLASIASSPPLAGPWDPRLTARDAPAAVEPSIDRGQRVGAVLPGRFRLDRVLARGSFGTVYAARQLAVDRDVAIKVLDRAVDPASGVGRLFVQEIQSVGRIDHPNVVRIHQADITSDGCLFYAMELLDGRDLQQIVESDGVLPQARAIEMVCQLLAGLAAAHEVGLVHADVKPSNTFVTASRDELRVVLVDFGLARLRAPGVAAESAGGTLAYMAPEQMQDSRVDARSDLFSAALLLVTLLTGWRRRSAAELAPPLEAIEDRRLRAVLSRAIATDPDDRYQTAAELSAALGGVTLAASAAAIRAPFRHLAPFIQADRLYGREHDLAVLVDHVLYRRMILYTAPSGTGKTSLLRAGLLPRLEGLGFRAVYLACRAGAETTLATEIWPGSTRIDEAVSLALAHHPSRLVILLDQVETLLARGGASAVLDEVIALERLSAERELAVVLGVREDFLASLLDREPLRGAPVVRLGPLTLEGAREAIVGPLAEQRIAVAEDLLATLLADLDDAAAAIAPELKWNTEHAVYPPHLQLACSVLYESLGPGEAVITLTHYRRLGGLDAIVGEYLERVLETELPDATTVIARELLVALVNSSDQTRAFRSEAALEDAVAARHDREAALPVLDTLRARGLVVRLRSPTGEPGWELVHDSLVSRVLAWLDRRDLARRGAIELLRHHLRRSRPGQPKLLGADELRELRGHPGVVEELDAELARRGGTAMTAKALVSRSRRARRVRWGAIAAGITGVLAASAVLGYRWLQHELRADGNIGRFTLELRAFDWDPIAQRAIPVAMASLPELDWALYEPSDEDELDTGMRRSDADRTLEAGSAMERAWIVAASGGRAQLRVTGRGRDGTSCEASVIPLRRLPGFASSGTPRFTVYVPTCQASAAGMIEIPEGPFFSGGRGEPEASLDAGLREKDFPTEEQVQEPAFSIDRTEVSNAAFRMFSAEASSTVVPMPRYPPTVPLKHAGEDRYPVSNITWAEARAYCRFLGKELPTDHQWQKAMRGGVTLDGARNPMPKRNLPWGSPINPAPANLSDTGPEGPAPVGSSPGDVSPYGVLDLAGNVQEWTRSTTEGFIITRGCYWTTCSSSNLVTFMAIPNARAALFRNFELGFRCSWERR
ncbi:MAG TPA: SUMF1/EgtB/PvdO family nonheme iron enzyme [Kofleriaceae bacterium]|nr:SUMF1/EgtB/PvdO family nonheme iron enzyme [Kofleriaceae bacterium]